MTWDGEAYQQRFDHLSATGTDVHGEATLVCRYEPTTVLDAGCGTGRVAIELARRGVDVVGVDVDGSMLEAARRRQPTIEWLQADLATLDLDRSFDLVVLAGNVLLFTPPGTEAAVVASCARHLAPGGRLVAGFSLDRSYGLDDLDRACADAGLGLEDRWATWSMDPYVSGGSYAVSVHRAAT